MPPSNKRCILEQKYQYIPPSNKLKKHTTDCWLLRQWYKGWWLIAISLGLLRVLHRRKHVQVYPGTERLLEQAVQGRLNWKVWWMAEYRGNSQRNSCWKFESNPELWQSYPQRLSKNPSQTARWTFQRTGRKAIRFPVLRTNSLVAVDDQCFDCS